MRCAPLQLPSTAPLPSPDEARTRLGRELLRPEYHEEDLLGRVLGAIDRAFDRLLSATTSAPMGSVVLALIVGFALLAGLLWILTRLRRTGTARSAPGPVLPERRISAQEHRSLASEAMARGAYAQAVQEAFRAAVLRPVEAGRVPERPGATASELAAALMTLVESQPGSQAQLVRTVADDFDAVVYGHHEATSQQAEAALALDDLLAGALR